MSLAERARIIDAEKDDCSLRSGKLDVEELRTCVQRIISADDIVQLLAKSPERARNEVKSACRQVFSQPEWEILEGPERQRLIEELLDLVFGLGPIESLIADESVTEVMVNGTHSIYYEREGLLHRSQLAFSSDEQVRALIDRIIGPLGRRIDESSPMVNARLEKGYRVNAIIPPLAIDGPVLTIRTFSDEVITLDDMVESKSLESALKILLVWAIRTRKNLAVSGGTGSGKTTFLNALSCHIPHSERVLTIEDSAELRFKEHPHVVRLEARPRNAEGKGEVTIRDLVTNALRMRPDRIIVGECRGGEALDMLQAMNTGHDGSLTTLHANSPEEVVARLVTMVRYAADLPVDVIEAHVASALDLIIQTSRSLGGQRYVSQLSEISFDKQRRACLVKALYIRKGFEEQGHWVASPEWLFDAVQRGALSREEVSSWMSSIS